MKIMRINCLNEPPGGVERYIRETDIYLSKLGHEVITAEINSTGTPGNLAFTEHLYVNGSHVRRALGDVFSEPSVLKSLLDIYRRSKPDIIHIHHFRVSFMAVARFVNLVDTPCVYTAHDAQLICPIATLVLPNGNACEGGVKPRCFFTGCKVGLGLPYEIYRVMIFNKLVKQRISAYICPSLSMKKYLEAYGYTPAIFVQSLPNIDTSSFAMLPIPAENTIGFLGRIEKNKGLQFLIQALGIAKNAIPDIHLNIAGDGGFLPYIKILVERLDLSSHVSFLGYIPKENHKEFFASIKFTVIPSIMIENRVFVAQESFGFGRPVIASSVGGIPEIVKNNYNGILVKPANSDELALEMVNLLKDESRLKYYSENAFLSLNETTTDTNGIDGILKVYEAIIQKATSIT